MFRSTRPFLSRLLLTVAVLLVVASGVAVAQDGDENGSTAGDGSAAFESPDEIRTFLTSLGEWIFTIGVLGCGIVCIGTLTIYGMFGSEAYARRSKIAGAVAGASFLVFFLINSIVTSLGGDPLGFAPV
jgi:hypothetical protein